MDLVNIITLVISGVSAASVFIMSSIEARRSKLEKLEKKQTTWYQAEVLSPAKTNEHFADLARILEQSNLTKQQKCEDLNEAMLNFFYNSINYIAFFDVDSCNELKQKIMVAIDEVMYSVLVTEDEFTHRDAEKTLTVYRMRIMHLFYEFDMSNQMK